MKKKTYIIVERDGTACPRCNFSAEVREHKTVTEKQLSQPFYFTR